MEVGAATTQYIILSLSKFIYLKTVTNQFYMYIEIATVLSVFYINNFNQNLYIRVTVNLYI